MKNQATILTYNKDMEGYARENLAASYGLESALDKLAEVADYFSIADVKEQVVDYLDDFAGAETEWMGLVEDDFYESAPWRTGNLREAIDTDYDDFPTVRVGIDQDKLMARAGQRVRLIRRAYLDNGPFSAQEVKLSKVPTYPELIDEGTTAYGEEWKAVSASSTVDPIEPNTAREMNRGTHTPYIEAIWWELAQKRKKEIFG